MEHKTMFHTQERRSKKLEGPVKCIDKDAWLGPGYYFWLDDSFAMMWGNKFKNRTGYYEIFKAKIDCQNILDTVFNQKHYDWWIKQLEKLSNKYTKKNGKKPSLEETNKIMMNALGVDNINGIMFADSPNQNEDSYIDKKVGQLNYRKRIQLVVYNENIILTFAPHLTYKCN